MVSALDLVYKYKPTLASGREKTNRVKYVLDFSRGAIKSDWGRAVGVVILSQQQGPIQ
jgi:hypothetical protein